MVLFGEVKQVTLPQPELWVIDWITCAQGSPEVGEKLSQLMAWDELRERVWRAQLQAELSTKDPAKPVDANIDLTIPEIRQILALIPTTFRWGTGEDCGFSLKRRLSEVLWGEEEKEKFDNREMVDNLLRSTSSSELGSSLVGDHGPADEHIDEHIDVPPAFMES